MAHWIIDDHGFGGTYYRCSECGESWCDIYSDVSMEETCPNCGAPINEDETEYIEKKNKGNILKPWTDLLSLMNRNNQSFRDYVELENKLITLTGYNLEQLIELFAAGYTLEPPKYVSFDEILKEVR